MFNEIIKEIDFGGQKLTLRTGKVARQASGAVLAQIGGTVVLAAVTVSKKPLEIS